MPWTLNILTTCQPGYLVFGPIKLFFLLIFVFLFLHLLFLFAFFQCSLSKNMLAATLVICFDWDSSMCGCVCLRIRTSEHILTLTHKYTHTTEWQCWKCVHIAQRSGAWKNGKLNFFVQYAPKKKWFEQGKSELNANFQLLCGNGL